MLHVKQSLTELPTLAKHSTSQSLVVQKLSVQSIVLDESAVSFICFISCFSSLHV